MPIGTFHVRDMSRNWILFTGSFDACCEAQACYYHETPEMMTEVIPADSDYDN